MVPGGPAGAGVVTPGGPAPEDGFQDAGGLRAVAIALIGFAAGYLLSGLAVTAVGPLAGYHGRSGEAIPLGVLVAGEVALWIGLVVAAIKVSRDQGTRSVVRDYGLRIGAWWDLPLGAAVGLGSQYGLIRLLYLPFEHVIHHLNQRLNAPAERDTSTVHTQPELAIALLLLAVGAPLVEELFFRGLLLRGLLGACRRLRAGLAVVVPIVLSALGFALAHFEAVQFLGLAAFGVVLALMAWRWQRLAPTIAAHAAFNAAAVVSITHLR